MTLVSRVAFRYLAASSLWESAKKDLEEFSRVYSRAMSIREPLSAEDQEFIGKFADPRARKEVLVTHAKGFTTWYYQCASDVNDPDNLTPSMDLVADVIMGSTPLSQFQEELTSYSDAVQSLLDSTSSEQFQYQGFQIVNPEHLSDTTCRKMLEGVDYLVALFKRKGMTPLLNESVTRVILLPDSPAYSGLYNIRSREITLFRNASVGSGNFLTKWINEVFLHEFGHYIHMTYIPNDAREYWNSGWGEIKSKREAIQEAFHQVTSKEMKYFFDLLSSTGGSLQKAAKKLSSVLKVKFAYWLRNPTIGGPLITEKQLRWSKEGEHVAKFFQDPAKYVQESDAISPNDSDYEQHLAKRIKKFEEKLGVGLNYSLPMSSEVVEELTSSDPTLQKALEDALDKLGIVSEYGRTNEREDFAESFVAFMVTPERLSDTAKFRMQRTLSLSGIYGKPVAKLARKSQLCTNYRSLIRRELRKS